MIFSTCGHLVYIGVCVKEVELVQGVSAVQLNG